MKQFIQQSLEKALNHYLALDPESSKRLLALQNKIIAIELLLIKSPDTVHFSMIKVFLEVKDNKINLTQQAPEHVDVIIKGTPLALLGLSLLKQNRHQFFADDVSINGNLELGQQVIDLFDEIDIDWEEYSSRFLGDVASHQLGRLVNSSKQLVKNTHDVFLQNINEFIHEEFLMYPPKEALQDFYTDIDQLRMDADRLQARVNRLKKMKEDLK